jgi:hypothetical protein
MTDEGCAAGVYQILPQVTPLFGTGPRERRNCRSVGVEPRNHRLVPPYEEGNSHLRFLPTTRQVTRNCQNLRQCSYRTGTRCLSSSSQFKVTLICSLGYLLESASDRGSITMNDLPSGLMS